MTNLIERLRAGMVRRPVNSVFDKGTMDPYATAALMDEAATALSEAKAENERLREALTPSGDTKAAYIGEFKITLHRTDEAGDEYAEDVMVPWTTIKEIMAAISDRALNPKGGDNGEA